jgi:hypothetical protein
LCCEIFFAFLLITDASAVNAQCRIWIETRFEIDLFAKKWLPVIFQLAEMCFAGYTSNEFPGKQQ